MAMKAVNVPAIGPRYWTAITVASLFGANLGDFASRDLHAGHWGGLLPLAAIFAAILLAEARSRVASQAYYWLAIITLRTAATNLADLAVHDFHLGYAGVIPALAALLVALVAARRQATGSIPVTDGWYWAAMLTAGTLGTATGDGVAEQWGLGLVAGTALLGTVLLALLALRRRVATQATYWAAIAAVRAAGTTAGDFSAHTLGLPASTALTGLVLLAILSAWPAKRLQAA